MLDRDVRIRQEPADLEFVDPQGGQSTVDADRQASRAEIRRARIDRAAESIRNASTRQSALAVLSGWDRSDLSGLAVRTEADGVNGTDSDAVIKRKLLDHLRPDDVVDRSGTRDKRASELRESDDPTDNAAKIRALVNGNLPVADLYRTAITGPSGQRSRIAVGRVRYRPDSAAGEFEIVDPREGHRAGWVSRSVEGPHEYVVHSEGPNGEVRLEGWASTISRAADVLVHGQFAAGGSNHDTGRLSGGMFTPYAGRNMTVEQLQLAAARDELRKNQEALKNPSLLPGIRASHERMIARLDADIAEMTRTPAEQEGVEQRERAIQTAQRRQDRIDVARSNAKALSRARFILDNAPDDEQIELLREELDRFPGSIGNALRTATTTEQARSIITALAAQHNLHSVEAGARLPLNRAEMQPVGDRNEPDGTPILVVQTGYSWTDPVTGERVMLERAAVAVPDARRDAPALDTPRVNGDDGTMTTTVTPQDDIRALADRARKGNATALREFTQLAKDSGFEGRPGGWIYRGDTAVAQGWQGLADKVHARQVKLVPERAATQMDQIQSEIAKYHQSFAPVVTPTRTTRPAVTGEPTLGVRETSAGRETTVTLPDGTIAKRTSKTREYTHAVVATRDQHQRAQQIQADTDRRQAYVDALQAWVDRGSNTDELKAYPSGSLSYNDVQAGKSRNEYYLPGFEPVRKSVRGGRDYWEDSWGFSLPNFKDTTREATYTGRGNYTGPELTAWEQYGPSYVLDQQRGNIVDNDRQVAELNAGPRYAYEVIRWSGSRGNAQKAASSEFSNSWTTYRVIGVGDDISGQTADESRPVKVKPTAEERAATKAARDEQEKADRAKRNEEWMERKVTSIRNAVAEGNAEQARSQVVSVTEAGLRAIGRAFGIKSAPRGMSDHRKVEWLRAAILEAANRQQKVIGRGASFSGNPGFTVQEYESLTDADWNALMPNQQDNVRFVLSQLARRQGEPETTKRVLALQKRFGTWRA